jgi:hypothetical protein
MKLTAHSCIQPNPRICGAFTSWHGATFFSFIIYITHMSYERRKNLNAKITGIGMLVLTGMGSAGNVKVKEDDVEMVGKKTS